MDARWNRIAWIVPLLLAAMGAQRRTANFIVETADPVACDQIAQAAENWRRDLAVSWLGQAMPNWSAPCMMTVKVGSTLGAGGATTFTFNNGEVFGWKMNIQGSLERVLDSVLPHEITHMIFACQFRRPTPRWADEGGATSVEHEIELSKHRNTLIQCLHTNRGIAFNQMFAMTEYPSDVAPLYAQGYSVADFLIQRGGRREFVAFLADGMNTDKWNDAVNRHYQMADLGVLQVTWLDWVRQGSPHSAPQIAATAAPTGTPTAPVATTVARPQPNLILRMNKEPMPAMPGPVPSPASQGVLVPAATAQPAQPASHLTAK